MLLDGRLLVEGRDYSIDYERAELRLRAPLEADVLLEILYEPAVSVTPMDLQPTAAPRGSTLRRLAALHGLVPTLPALRGGVISPAVRVPSLKDQLQSGLRLSEYRDDVRQGKTGQGAVSYRRADALDPRLDAAGREEFATRLDLQSAPGSRFRLNQTVARESLLAQGYREQEQRLLQFDRTFGRSAASLLWEQNRYAGPDLAYERDRVGLGLTHALGRRTSAEGSVSLENSLYRGRETSGLFTLRQLFGSTADAQVSLQQRASELSGNTLETGVTLSARPRPGSEVQVGFRQSDSERYGRYQRLSADAQAQLHSRVQVTGEVAQRSVQGGTGVLSYGFGVAARPTGRSLVEATQQESLAADQARERNRLVRFTADPSAALKVQLGFQEGVQHEAGSSGGLTRNALWNVQAGGRRYVKVDGYSGVVQRPGEVTFLDSLYRLEVKPAGAFALSTSLRQVDLGATDRSLLGLGTTVSLRRGVDLTAAYRQPQGLVSGSTPSSGHEVRLKLAPVAGIRFFGGYNVRPEDTRGALLDEEQQTVGAETRLGSLSVIGSLTNLDRPTLVAAEQRWDLLATLSLGESTRLFGGIRSREGGTADRVFGRSYRFGVSQGIGSSLFLMLEGELGYAFDGTGARSLDPDNTRAQARFGVRF